MRGIRGYIRNLSDGEGPSVGTVRVQATPRAKPLNIDLPIPIDLIKHRLGALTILHQPGSHDERYANQKGHFGWDIELSPGLIDLTVDAHEPEPTQYHRRFPEESAQIGKAFITDLERLGWAGGKDGLIWDAVYGGDQPGASWSVIPTVSVNLGNWSLASGGIGPDAGRVWVRKGIAMLGGTVFSVELGDLLVPVAGDDPMPPNTDPTKDRYDLLCLRIDWNPLSPEYGKQSFEFTKGQPGAGVPAFPGNADNYRRLPLWAAKMPANTSTYSGGVDLRTWLNPPAATPATALIQQRVWFTSTGQSLSTPGNTVSNLNAVMGADAVELSLDQAWEGSLTWEAFIRATAPPSGGVDATRNLYVVPTTQGWMRDGTPVANTDYVLSGPGYPNPGLVSHFEGAMYYASATLPIRPIPRYRDTGSRSWDRLTVGVTYAMSFPSWGLQSQRVVLTMRPIAQ